MIHRKRVRPPSHGGCRRSSTTTPASGEVELAVVIGRRARYLDSLEDAADCVAGYATSNDVSEREFRLERGGQWDKGTCSSVNASGCAGGCVRPSSRRG
ncbi:hypothetical protein GTZ85_10340 [Streptomyces sp. SID5474]|nr:hypothetical protein [Streptomyces sp. SID5474]